MLVGGTGLYFKALTTGLAAVPPIPDGNSSGACGAGCNAKGHRRSMPSLRGSIPRPRNA